MTQQRRFHRIPLAANISLIEGDMAHAGNLENVSLNGALASFSDRVPVHVGERCVLTIRVDGEDDPLRLEAEVVQTCFTMVGMQFVAADEATLMRLYELMERKSGDPARLKAELDLLRGRATASFHPGRLSPEDRADA